MSFGKRGMALENMVELSNKTYKNKGMALIDKVPTPWVVNRNKRTGKVFNAFPQKKGTVDFVGVSHGRSIAFEAKSTKQRTRFDLSNIQQHQVDYLLKHQDQGGISFFIIRFDKYDEVYYLTIDQLIGWWDNQFKGGRKSIPYDWFVENVDLIKSKNGVLLDYLSNCKLDLSEVK